jgi:hypothetical protein
MRLTLFHNSPAAQATIPYILSVSLDGEVIPPDTYFHVPVHYERRVGNGALYNVEICGFRVEASTPADLFEPVETLLMGLINMARLPTYVFAAGDSQQLYPVYTIEDEVMATTPGGPVFRHVELAKVRHYLSDYLHTMEQLGQVNKSERLHVRGVDMNTLGLIRPVFYLKKRVPGENEFWAPVFPSPDGASIYTFAASRRREVPVNGGTEVLALQALVAQALIADRRLNDPFDLRPDRLFPEGWERLRQRLLPQPYRLTYPAADGRRMLTMRVYRHGKKYLVAEHRQHEDRYNLFLGEDPFDLQRRVARDLARRGVVQEAEVRLDEADVPPAT